MCQTVCDTVYHTLMESSICFKQVNKDLRILRVRKDPLCRVTRYIIPCTSLYAKYAIVHRSFALLYRVHNLGFPLFFPLFSTSMTKSVSLQERVDRKFICLKKNSIFL